MLNVPRPQGAQETLLLKKDDRLPLTKNRNLKKIYVGLGWDVNYKGPLTFDLDIIAFMLQSNGKVERPLHTVYWGNRQSPEGAIVISPDNVDGSGEGDDEHLQIDFSKVPPNVEKIVVAVYIYDAHAKEQNFGMVDNSYLRIVEGDANGRDLARFNLQDEYFKDTAIICGEFIRTPYGWDFKAVGKGLNEELAGLCEMYGAI